MTNYIIDFLHAVRTLVKARAFTAVCVASLGVGMGVVIAIMLMSRLIIGIPSGVDDEQLVEFIIRPEGALKAQAGTAMIDDWSYPDYLDVRDGASGMLVTGWSRGAAQVRLPGQTTTAEPPAMYVSSNYFSTIGVTLTRGRGFTSADDASVAEPEAVIGHRIWQVRFNSDPDIIGRAVTINQTEYTIVGVAPEGFRGHVAGLDDGFTVLWLPLSRHPRLSGDDSVRLKREASLVRIVAKLPPETTVPQADAMVKSLMSAVAARYPSINREKIGGVEPYFPPGAAVRSQVRSVLVVMFGLASMVLLVVGLNLSGMMLVRSAMRQRELAIRMAMGAGRWRLMRYHLTEAFALAVLGGGLASALLFGVPIVAAWWFEFYGPELDLFTPDLWIVLQCIGLCFVTSLVLGWLPALRFSRPAILAALKNDASGGSRRVGRLQRLTAALQAGIAVPFLVIGLIRVDQARVTALAEVGYNPYGLYAARISLPAISNTDEAQQRFVRTVRDTLAQASGISSVTLGDGLPLDFIYRDTRIARQGDSTFIQAHTTRIAPGYMDTLGIRMLAGRTIDVNDGAAAERVVVLSEPLARQLFPDGNPLGERVSFALAGHAQQTYTVVGVTADLVSTQMGNPRPQLFISLEQHPAETILAIARGNPSDPSVRRAFETALGYGAGQLQQRGGQPGGGDVMLRDLITGEELIENSYSDILTQGAASGIAASVALTLATLGIYGVIAFMVATRTREIGVRVALGASKMRVLRDVLVDALKLVVPGIALGLMVGAFIVRVADPTWYPLGGVEPLVYTLAAMIAFAVAVLAGIPSARRAAAVHPMEAIRSE
jgi:predicted permease